MKVLKLILILVFTFSFTFFSCKSDGKKDESIKETVKDEKSNSEDNIKVEFAQFNSTESAIVIDEAAYSIDFIAENLHYEDVSFAIVNGNHVSLTGDCHYYEDEDVYKIEFLVEPPELGEFTLKLYNKNSYDLKDQDEPFSEFSLKVVSIK